MKGKINKYHIILLILLAGCLFLLPQCFQGKEAVLRLEGSSMAESGQPYYYSPEMTLSPGVYQICVYCENLPEEGVMGITLTCPQASHKALRGNTVNIYGQDGQDFEVYVLDTLKGARLECSITDADYHAVSEIYVYKTSIGARLLLCMFLFAGGVLCLLLRFRDNILSGRIPKSRQIVVWSLAAAVLIAYLPYLSDYFIMGGADRAYHLLRIEGLKETLLHGNQFPVRVQAYWLYDHGYMTSVFYGDLFLYIPALLRILGFPLGLVSKITLLLILTAHALIAFHCLHKCTGSDYAALLGTICTLLSPYYFHNIYSRGAFGEYTAMMLLPLVITGMFLLYTRDPADPGYRNYKWYLIAGLSALLQCHLITCEMSAVMIIVFALIHFKKTFRKETFLQLAQAAGMILLLNCFFWLPMLHMMSSDAFAFQTLTEQKIQWKGINISHLLQLTTNRGGAQTEMYNAETLHPGAALLFALLLFALYGLKERKESSRKICVHLFAWVTVLLFLSTKYFPWDALKAVPAANFLTTAIQFPYRLLSPVIMLGGFFLAHFYLFLQKNASGWVFKGCICFLAALCLIPALYQVNDIAFTSKPTRLYSAENMGTISVINGEYLLKGSAVEQYHAHGPIADEHITWSGYEKEGTTVRMNITNSSSQTEYIELPLTGYQGYVVTSPLYIAEERGYNNDLRIAVPGGFSGDITVCYREHPLWLAADFLSLAALLLTGGYWAVHRFHRRAKV